MKTHLIRSVAIIALLGLALPAVLAQDAGIKQRLEQRLPALDDLRQRQIVGENNRGFLEVRGEATAEEIQLVEAENRDRKEAYALLARGSGTTAESVGLARAKKLAAVSVRGVLVQDEDGNWAPKK